MSEAELIAAMHEERAPELVRAEELAALRADLKTQREINGLLRLENETLGMNLAALRARVAELEAQLAAVVEQRDAWKRRYEHNTTDAYNARITEALNRMRENEAQP